MRYRFYILALLLSNLTCFTCLTWAIEPTNPLTLCERFIAPETKKDCENKIKKIAPDWYLATVCEKQFEDKDFFSCLELSEKYNFSPAKLGPCAEHMLDSERLGCLKMHASEFAFQDEPSTIKGSKTRLRKPASKNLNKTKH